MLLFSIVVTSYRLFCYTKSSYHDNDGNNHVVFNGVDVTDVTRTFTDEEWTALGPNYGRAYVLQQRERLRGGEHNEGSVQEQQPQEQEPQSQG